MLNASTITTVLAIAAIVGAPLSLYVWRFRRHQLEVQRGLAALAAMRWRDFSGFVVDALQAQGFEAAPADLSAHTGQKRDLRLTRNGTQWLLGFRQEPDTRIDARQVAGFAGNVRASGASGGILATLGAVQKDAGDNSPEIELLHGKALWTLVEPRLPAGLLKELSDRARRGAVRETTLGLALSLLAGVTVAFAMPGGSDDGAQTAPTALTAPVSPPPRPAAATRPEAVPAVTGTTVQPSMTTVDESVQREQIIKRLGNVAGIERAAWSTRSTLLVILDGIKPDGPELTRAVCAVLSEYVDLRASRLQLQPPEGSGRRVRFMQCHTW